MTETAEAVRYRVTRMDCSACAAKIEAAARSIAGVRPDRLLHAVGAALDSRILLARIIVVQVVAHRSRRSH